MEVLSSLNTHQKTRPVSNLGASTIRCVDELSGEVLQQYWFLRENETSLHAFSRVAYHNSSTGFNADLQALRTLFRPAGPYFTHLVSNKDFHPPEPQPNPAIDDVAYLGVAAAVQDATWYIGNRTGEPADLGYSLDVGC